MFGFVVSRRLARTRPAPRNNNRIAHSFRGGWDIWRIRVLRARHKPMVPSPGDSGFIVALPRPEGRGYLLPRPRRWIIANPKSHANKSTFVETVLQGSAPRSLYASGITGIIRIANEVDCPAGLPKRSRRKLRASTKSEGRKAKGEKRKAKSEGRKARGEKREAKSERRKARGEKRYSNV